MEKVDFFQKLRLVLALGVRFKVSYSSCENDHFSLDGVQGWESDEKRIFGQRFWPKAWKKWTFFES